MNPREQKNHLRKAIHDLFGNIVDIETTIKEISTSNAIDYPEDYVTIIRGLSNFRGHVNFNNKNRQPEFDYVISEKRIIIEYDERQHFSKAREISLKNYPKNVKTFFDKTTWISNCNKIGAIDNDPIDRDERRAFYDSVRDIESYRLGWYLMRFYHGEFDWSGKDAVSYLRSRIKLATKTKIEMTRKSKARVLRIALKKDYDSLNKDGCLTDGFKHVADQIKNNQTFDYLVTPGGFLKFDWPKALNNIIKDQGEAQKIIPQLEKSADIVIQRFWNTMPAKTKRTLQSSVKFITFGIDSYNDGGQGIQFVALFDTTKSKVIHWTAKSYPTVEEQRHHLITFEDLETHFKKVNKETICLLGCHDLKMFSPRAKATAKGERQRKIKQFDKLMKQFKPNIIIHHPHSTDTYKIWNTEWKTVGKMYPFVNEYVSGIRYYNNGEKKRGKIDQVLQKLKLGEVEDIRY